MSWTDSRAQGAGSTYTLTPNDSGRTLKFSSNSVTTISVPADLPEDFGCTIIQSGLGQVRVRADQGVQVMSFNGHGGSRRYAPLSLTQVGYNLYTIDGERAVPAPYLGAVATRCVIPRELRGGADSQVMCRSRHTARDNLDSLRLVYANWYQSESNGGSTAAVTASVEYPIGVYTQVGFAGTGAATLTAGATVTSDTVPVAIPDGADFFVRTYFINSTGVPINAIPGDYANGDACEIGTSVDDKTMSGTIGVTNPGANLLYTPVAIIGYTTKPTFALVGDSRVIGGSDSVAGDTTGDMGCIARSIGAAYGYMNMGNGGEFAQTFIATHAKRLALAAYCSHVVVEYGINDIGSGRTAAQVYADLQTIWGYFTGKTVIQQTITPYTSSSDGWTTLAGQTPQSIVAARPALNDLIRATPIATARYVEVADVVESSRNSGKWKVPGYADLVDGIHETYVANAAIRDSGVLNPYQFYR